MSRNARLRTNVRFHFQYTALRGACGKHAACRLIGIRTATTKGLRGQMRVLSSRYTWHEGVEPMGALAVHSRALGAEARVCVGPDVAQRLARVDGPLAVKGAWR